MSETPIQKVPSSNGLITEIDNIVTESGVNNEDEETWLYENNKSKGDETVDNTTAPSIDEITTQEIDAREKATMPILTIPNTISLIDNQLDDDSDDDDDGIQITIGNYEPEASSFQTNRQKGRTSIQGGPVMLPKPPTIRGVDFDAQGVINGQPTYEYDLMHSYKDEEKPWKKPGADISDYFNYGFTEETWAQYCDRQRRLRSDNNLARLNISHLPPMSPMVPGHPPMLHPMNPHPVMMINKQMNMQMMPRPFMNIRKPDGKIDVIGATDLTSRRPMFDSPNNFDHPPFISEPSFPGGQQSNGQTVGDLVSTTPSTNGPPPSRGTPPSNTHSMPTHGMHRLPMMLPPPGMQFRPPFGRPHGPGGPQFFPHGPAGGMHGERPPQTYFLPRHPQQQLWDKPGAPPVHGFPPGHFPPQATLPGPGGNGRAPASRSPTPEDHSSRSSTPEENRPSVGGGGGGGGDNEKSSKEDRYKDRYRDDRDYHSSSHRRSPPKDRSSSAYRSGHRSGDHEYERPRNERKPSRDRDDKYERFSRKRHHREDSSRHPQRVDDESSRNHRSSRRTPPTTVNANSSVPIPTESSQIITEHPEPSETDQPSSSQLNRSRRDDSERSSSRHSHHKKSSKRSRHDSGDERTSSHHHRRSKDKSSTSSKKLINQTESISDVKEQNIE